MMDICKHTYNNSSGYCWKYQIAITFVLFIGFTPFTSAQCISNELHKLTASDPDLGDHFGTSALIHGELAIVGANWANVEQYLGGAAYVFRKDPVTNKWFEEQKVVANDPGPGDGFALSIAINPVDPSVIIVGAWADDDAPDCCDNCSQCQSGSAYIFRFDPDLGLWQQEQKLTASDASSQDRFGWAVSIWGDVAIVGARLDDDPTPQTGSAYVFRYDQDSGIWNEQQKLIPPMAGRFGTSISMEEDVVLIGAPIDDEFVVLSGAAYIYQMAPETQIWQFEQKLVADDPVLGGSFGWSVSLDGNNALIAAPGADGVFFLEGAAYVFSYDGKQWSQQQKLFASDGKPLDTFGRAVSLAGNTAVVSAVLDELGEDTLGSAYIFKFDGKQWNEEVKLYAAEFAGSEAFGTHANTDGQHIIVGANFADVNGENEAGSAFIFGGLGDCNDNGIIDICDIADGNSTDKNNNGLPDECEPPLCPWDIDNSGAVGTGDLIILFAQWGTPGSADFNTDGIVNTTDLLILLANWGQCQ